VGVAEKKQDRELIELLNELRVALPGVQVLFAFLLVVPFSQGFAEVTATQKHVFFAAFVCTTVATLMLIAPSTYHRLRWREHDKEQMLTTSNKLVVVGMAFLALAMSCVVYFITSFLYPDAAALVTAAAASAFAFLWFGLPLYRHFRGQPR
jgi:cobalamin synthase